MNTILEQYNRLTTSRLDRLYGVQPEGPSSHAFRLLCVGPDVQLRWTDLLTTELQNHLAMCEVRLSSGHRAIVPTQLPVILGIDRNLSATTYTIDQAKGADVFVPFAARLPCTSNPQTEIYNDGVAKLKETMTLDFYFGKLLGVSFNNVRFDHGKVEVRFKHPHLVTDFQENLAGLYLDSVLPRGKLNEQLLFVECPELSRKFVRWMGPTRPHWLPSFLLSGQEDFRRGFFIGLLENSGTLCGTKQLYADCATTSQHVALGLYWLAASLNVRATVQQIDQLYRVRFRGIPPEFGHEMSNKWRAKCLNIRGVEPADADVIPVSRTLAQSIMKMAGRERHSLQESFRLGANNGGVSRAKAREALVLFEDKISALDCGKLWSDLVKNAAVAWSRIDEILTAPASTVGIPVLSPGTLGWTSAGGIILAGL